MDNISNYLDFTCFRWWKLTYKKFLSSEDGEKILEETEQPMVSINLRALSIDYQDHLRKVHYQYELKDVHHMITELKHFLCHTSKNNIRILSISSTSSGSTAVKGFAALETLRDYKHEDSFLVVSSGRLNDTEKMEQWIKTLELGVSKLLVIICENGVRFHEIYNQLGTTMKKRMINWL